MYHFRPTYSKTISRYPISGNNVVAHAIWCYTKNGLGIKFPFFILAESAYFFKMLDIYVIILYNKL